MDVDHDLEEMMGKLGTHNILLIITLRWDVIGYALIVY